MVLKQDLRYIKTERAFKDAFLQLLDETPRDKISIAKLCERAQCSRPAFYNHFASMDDLYSDIIDDFVEHLYNVARRHDIDPERPEEDHRASSEDFFRTFMRHKSVILTLLKGDRSHVQYQLIEKLQRTYMTEALEISGKRTPDPSFEPMAAYGAGGNIAFMLNCLTSPDIDLDRAEQIYVDLQSRISEFAVNLYRG